MLTRPSAKAEMVSHMSGNSRLAPSSLILLKSGRSVYISFLRSSRDEDSSLLSRSSQSSS